MGQDNCSPSKTGEETTTLGFLKTEHSFMRVWLNVNLYCLSSKILTRVNICSSDRAVLVLTSGSATGCLWLFCFFQNPPENASSPASATGDMQHKHRRALSAHRTGRLAAGGHPCPKWPTFYLGLCRSRFPTVGERRVDPTLNSSSWKPSQPHLQPPSPEGLFLLQGCGLR